MIFQGVRPVWLPTEERRGVHLTLQSLHSKAISRGIAKDESCKGQQLRGLDLRQALETFMLSTFATPGHICCL